MNKSIKIPFFSDMLPKYTLLFICITIGYCIYRFHEFSTVTPSATVISPPLRNDSNNGIASTTKISLPSRNDSNNGIASSTEKISCLKNDSINEDSFTEKVMVSPFIDFYQYYVIAPKYNLASCQIMKSMSTLRVSIFCLLFDKESFSKKNLSFTETEWNTSACGEKHKVDDIKKVDKLVSDNSSMFVIIRDPIDRFLSGFIHICVNAKMCYDCKDDMACFIKKQYERYRGYSNGTLYKKDVQFLDTHLAPQTWFCSFNTNFHRYKIIRYGIGDEIDRMSDEMDEVFRASGVGEEDREFIRNETLKGKTPNSTYFTPERKKYEDILRNSPELMELLIRIYYYDFMVFGFPLPAVKSN